MSVPANGVKYSKDSMPSADIVARVIGGASLFSNYQVKKTKKMKWEIRNKKQEIRNKKHEVRRLIIERKFHRI